MKRITLLKPHTHDGVAHASGITLSVPDHVARWLLDHRVAIVAGTPRLDVTVPAPLPAPATESIPILDTPAPRIADIHTSGDTP
jgi:hypothetical protein